MFKDGLREGEECIEQLQFCLSHLKSQPNCFYSVINQGDKEEDMPLEQFANLDESFEEEN